MEPNEGCSSYGHEEFQRHPTTKEEQEEIALQEGSHRLEVEAQQRKEQLEADILAMRSNFKIQEVLIRKDRDCALLHKIRVSCASGLNSQHLIAMTNTKCRTAILKKQGKERFPPTRSGDSLNFLSRSRF